MCVYVTECRDIANPQKNHGQDFSKEEDSEEEEGGDDSIVEAPKMESRYLDKKFAIVTKAPKW